MNAASAPPAPSVRLTGRVDAAARRNLAWPLTLSVHAGEAPSPLCTVQLSEPGPIDIALDAPELVGRLRASDVLRLELRDHHDHLVTPPEWVGCAPSIEVELCAADSWPEAQPPPSWEPLFDESGLGWLRTTVTEALEEVESAAVRAALAVAREPLDAVWRRVDGCVSEQEPVEVVDAWPNFCAHFGEPPPRRPLLRRDALIELVARETAPAVFVELAAFECVADLASLAVGGSRPALRVLRALSGGATSLSETLSGLGVQVDAEGWLWLRRPGVLRVGKERLETAVPYALREVAAASGASYGCAGGVVTIHGDGLDCADLLFDLCSPGGAVLARVPARPVIGGAAFTLPLRPQLLTASWPSSVRLRPWLSGRGSFGQQTSYNRMRPAPGTPRDLALQVADLDAGFGDGRRIYSRQRVRAGRHVRGGELTVEAWVRDAARGGITMKGPSGRAARMLRRAAANGVEAWSEEVVLGGSHGLLSPGVHRLRLEASNACTRARREVEVRALQVHEAEIVSFTVDGEADVAATEVGERVQLAWELEGEAGFWLTAERLDTGALSELELPPGATDVSARLEGPTRFTLHVEGKVEPVRWAGHATPVRTRRSVTATPRVVLGPLEVTEAVRLGEDLTVRWSAVGAREVTVQVVPQRRIGRRVLSELGTASLTSASHGAHVHRVASRRATHLEVLVVAEGWDRRRCERKAVVALSPSIAWARLRSLGLPALCVEPGEALPLRCVADPADPGRAVEVQDVELDFVVANAAHVSAMLSLGGRRRPVDPHTPLQLAAWKPRPGDRGELIVTAASAEGVERVVFEVVVGDQGPADLGTELDKGGV